MTRADAINVIIGTVGDTSRCVGDHELALAEKELVDVLVAIGVTKDDLSESSELWPLIEAARANQA